MKVKENDVVSLLFDDTEVGVKKEYLGTVVEVQGRDICIEFLDDDGASVEKALDKYYAMDDVVLKWRSS